VSFRKLSLALCFQTTDVDDCADFKQYIILLNAVWAVSGLGYLVSVVVKPLNSQLAGVLIVLLSLMTNGIFVQKSRMGRVDSELHLPQASFAYHLSTALYLVKEDTFVSFAGLLSFFPAQHNYSNLLVRVPWQADYLIPNTEGVSFEANSCPLDQACMSWTHMKASLREHYSMHGEAGIIDGVSMAGLAAIGLLSRVGAFVALVATNRHKQV